MELTKQIAKIYNYNAAAHAVGNSYAGKDAMSSVKDAFPLNFKKEDPRKNARNLGSIDTLRGLMRAIK